MAGVPPRLGAAAAAILSHPRLEDAAAALGISSRSLRRWRSLPEFKEAMAIERRELLALATDHLRAAGVDAVVTLRAVLADKECSHAVKVQAAGCVLAHLFRAVEVSDIAERMEKLEESAENAKHSVN